MARTLAPGKCRSGHTSKIRDFYAAFSTPGA
jgi:hypothetical protein